MKIKHILKDQKGSISLEFIGVLPFFFMFMLLIFQGFALGYGVVTAQSAVNEAAKVYAAGDTFEEAKAAAMKVVGNSSSVSFSNLSKSEDSEGNFEATITVKVDLLFVPDQWKSINSLNVTQKASSRVMNSVFN
ncbi:TadE/TadG family type IV pilus assembly protein, partial [Bacillus sp. J33]|uniref:TadE/TadG family type IV pilus assembly protein n=1 Tax=Bacillus sp. J33 TaxID=935836 RepID=UPI0004AF056C